MDEKIKISILITTYNTEKYIDDTLTSVFGQKLDYNYEVLVGDDGSQDGTVEIIQKWIKKFPEVIRLYIMPRDSKCRYNAVFRVSQNRLNLVKYACGEYITFLDGDDVYIDENKLRKQIQILDNPGNSDCIMCGHNVNLFWEKESVTKPILPINISEQKLDKRMYWRSLWIHAEAFVFRKSFLREEHFKEFNKNYFDDNLITFFFMKGGEIYYIPDIMVNYRQNLTEWKAISNEEQHILNAMDYCIEKRYNPEMWISSIQRHYADFRILYINRNRSLNIDYEKYISQAKKDNFKEVLLFLNYKFLSVWRKLEVKLIFASMSLICWKRIQRVLNGIHR